MEISNTTNKILETIVPPLEQYFFTPEIQKTLAEEEKKLIATQDYVRLMLKKPELYDDYEMQVMSGRLYSSAAAINILAKLQAMEGSGPRYDLKKSVVSPTGQAIILSENACRVLNINFDTYIPVAELPKLVEALQADQIAANVIERVKKAANESGGVVTQRGGFVAIKTFLEEVVDKEAMNVPHGASLNALRSKIAAPAPPPIAQAPKAPKMTPEEIKREVNTKELTGQKAPAPIPPAPKPAQDQPKWVSAEPVKSKPVLPKLNNIPTLGLGLLNDIQVIDDLKRVEPAHLRQGNSDEQVKIIRSKISYLAQANKMLPVQVENVFEQSPLFMLYLQMGNALMAATTPDVKPDYNQVAIDLSSKGQEILSFAEFQAVADMRKDLGKM